VNERKKDLARQYRETPRPAGIYRIRHAPSGRTLVGSSPDAPAMLNRIRAELRMRGHRNRALQADWTNDGEAAFTFEVLDLLPVEEGSTEPSARDLEALLQAWVDELDLDDEERY
jgi:hypothetical protein